MGDHEDDHGALNTPESKSNPEPSEFEERLGPSGDDDDGLEVGDGDPARGRGGLTDDRSAEDLDIGDQDVADETSGGPIDDAPIDIGEPDVDFDDDAQMSDDGREESGLDHDADELLPMTRDDGGAEGLSGESADLLVDEAALPAMDAGEEGDFELHDLLGEMGFGGDDSWEVVPNYGSDVAVAQVVVRDGQLAAAGIALTIETSAGSRTVSLPRFARDVALLADGAVLLLTDAGVERLAPSSERPEPLYTAADQRRLVVAAGRTLILGGQGLHSLDPASGTVELLRTRVRSLGAAEGTLYFLAPPDESSEALALFRVRGQDGDEERVDDAGEVARGAHILACDAQSVVLVEDDAATLVRAGHGRQRVVLTGIVASAIREKSGEVFFAVRREHALEIYVVDPVGALARVAQLPLQGAKPGPVNLAWDRARDWLLVASTSGLAALRPRLEH